MPKKANPVRTNSVKIMMCRLVHFLPGSKYRREGRYSSEGSFIALVVEPMVAPDEALRPIPFFPSISSGELTVQLPEFVSLEHNLSLLNKRLV
jgi:hypothetical protein